MWVGRVGNNVYGRPAGAAAVQPAAVAQGAALVSDTAPPSHRRCVTGERRSAPLADELGTSVGAGVLRRRRPKAESACCFAERQPQWRRWAP